MRNRDQAPREPAPPLLSKRLVAQLLTKMESATIARCSVRTIERAIARGDLRAGGTRGRRLIALDELQRWLDGQGSGAAAPNATTPGDTIRSATSST